MENDNNARNCNLPEAQETVRRLLEVLLHRPATVVDLKNEDLDLVLRVARRVRLLGRIAVSLKQIGQFDRLPATAQEQLDSALVVAESRARLAKWELNRICWALRNNPEITLVAMKGCAYILLNLPNAAGRIFADVDLLLPEQELGKVEILLNQRGWKTEELTAYDQNYYRKWTHELPPLIHVKREVEIDLHHNIMPRTARLNPSSEKLRKRLQVLPGSRYRVLANEDISLHAMTHLMFDGDMVDKLRDLVDIHELLANFSNEDREFWRRLIDRAVEMDLTRPAFYSIRYSRCLLNTPVPNSVVEATESWAPPAIAVWLMDRMVPRALYPQHPDRPSKVTDFCRLLLYVRSHWIRMPPWLLVYHLGYKFLVTRVLARNT